jgi:hypothetical protein
LSDDVVPSAHADAAGAAAPGAFAGNAAREVKPAHAAHAHPQREALDTHVERDARYGATYDGVSAGMSAGAPEVVSERASFSEPQFDGSRYDDRLNGTRQFDGHTGGPGGYAIDGHADARPFDGSPFDAHDDDPYDQAYAGHAQHDAGSDDDWGHSHQHDLANYHAPLWMNLAMPGGAQFDDERGYVIYVVAELVATSMYRAWAEIMRDGRRIERSGLIGPRFEDDEAARRFALEWATEWIDRECGAMAAYGDGGAAVAERAHVSNYASVNATTVSAQQSVVGLASSTPGQQAVSQQAAPSAAQVPVTRPMPESAAVKNALPAGANRNGNGGNGGNSGGNGNGSSGGANGSAQSPGASYPQHANAQRVQLRRYPSEGNNSTSADKTTDRFPPTRKLLSHMR